MRIHEASDEDVLSFRLPRPLRAAGAALLVLALAPGAEAQVRAWLAPIRDSYVSPVPSPPGHVYHFCMSARLEWELLIENGNLAPVTVTFTDFVRAGFNGNYLSLVCPPTLLPPGVDPATDVDCDDVTDHVLTVRNITVPPCDRVRLRFETAVDGGAGLQTVCNSGTIDGGASLFTRTPLADQVPKKLPSQTCFFGNTMCGFQWMLQTAVDENGPPLLPGDSLLWKIYFDPLKYSDVPLDHIHVNQIFDSPLPLPSGIEFVDWVAKPLEPLGAVHSYDPVTRELKIFDDDLTGPPEVLLPGGGFQDVATWRAQVRCDAPAGVAQCANSRFQIAMGFAFFEQDDPTTYALSQDSTCVTPVLPDFSTSTKSVKDADASGDAQPGETLTFTVNVVNTGPCPAGRLDCECWAHEVEVVDSVDTARLDNIQPLDGGALVAPDQVRWVIPIVAAKGTKWPVRFRARVRPGVAGGDLVCNTATITSAELKSVADGGISLCPSLPPAQVSLSPCMAVRIPPGPTLVVDKAYSPPAPPDGHPVGTTVAFAVTVTNAGGGGATNVVVEDALDAAWAPYTGIVPQNGGLLCTPLACDPARITWTIPSIPGNNGSATVGFTAVIPATVPDQATIPNSATARSTELPSAAGSNTVLVPVCAPVLALAKTLPKSTYAEGEAIAWTLTLTNAGGCAATGITVTDTVDLTKVEDTPTLTSNPPWTSKAGSTLTWSFATLPGNGGTQSIQLASRVRPGTGGMTVCNAAEATWTQAAAPPLVSAPACADLTPPACPASIPETGPVLAAKSGPTRNDVSLEWPVHPDAKDGYNVWRVAGKTCVPEAKQGGICLPPPVGVCLPTALPSCIDLDAVPAAAGTALFYQARAVCGGIEGL